MPLYRKLIKKTVTIISTAILFISSTSLYAIANDEKTGVERFALYVASNQGGEDRETLKYAGTDAQKLATTMTEVGGIKKQNSFLLIDSTKEEIDGAFSNITSIIKSKKDSVKRVEFIFYYSGHSDENALLLGDETYDYSSLKAAISDVPSDVHVVMLDSCFSGNFIRAKGGSRQKSFLVDDSSVVQGHAYLSSSSESEASQESDSIGASYFTNSLITGLRGAADASGDSKVSLNELYYYAFNETLSQTELSTIGPQHPSYNITLVGSGDLVLTDISEAESILVLPAEAEGRFLIRTLEGKLASEITKVAGSKMSLALPAGFYSITVINAASTSQATIKLAQGVAYTLENTGLQQVPLVAGTARGGTHGPAVPIESTVEKKAIPVEKTIPEEKEGIVYENDSKQTDDDYFDEETQYVLNKARQIAEKNSNDEVTDSKIKRHTGATTKENSDLEPEIDYDDDVEVTRQNKHQFPTLRSKDLLSAFHDNDFYMPVSIGLFFGVRLPSTPNAIIALSPFMASHNKIKGLQANAFMGLVQDTLFGFQTSGFMNILSGEKSYGAQVSGFMNIANCSLYGAQVSGFGNILNGELTGTQVSGFINTSKKFTKGSQIAGFINIASQGINGLQIAGAINIAKKETRGIQVAGLINIADKIKGIQVGVINVANENDGLSLGLFNFIKGGINSTSVYWENEQLYAQYKGGTKSFFTTFLCGTAQDFSKPYFNFGAGIGMSTGGGFISVDFEALYKTKYMWNTQIDISGISKSLDDLLDSETEEEIINKSAELGEKTSLAFGAYGYPCARITCNMNFSKHFGIFVAGSADLQFDGWNEKAFTDSDTTDAIEFIGPNSTVITVHPSVSFGIRF